MPFLEAYDLAVKTAKRERAARLRNPPQFRCWGCGKSKSVDFIAADKVRLIRGRGALSRRTGPICYRCLKQIELDTTTWLAELVLRAAKPNFKES